MTFDKIMQTVAAHYDIEPQQLVEYDRKRKLARARQVAMLLCKEETGATVYSIGQAFNRDHTTVLHNVEAIRFKMRAPDPGYDYKADVAAIRGKLRRNAGALPRNAYHAELVL